MWQLFKQFLSFKDQRNVNVNNRLQKTFSVPVLPIYLFVYLVYWIKDYWYPFRLIMRNESLCIFV